MVYSKNIKTSEFIPKNPERYTGTYPIIMRSQWERDFAEFLDENPFVINWDSEPKFSETRGIPYHNPLENKQTIYIPDFLVKFKTVSGREVIKLIEIKPLHETYFEFNRNSDDYSITIKNQAKWAEASAWCERRDIEFQVLTERELYPGNYQPPKKKIGKKKK